MSARRRRSPEATGTEPELPQRGADVAPIRPPVGPAAISALQRSVGNAAVQQLVARQAETTAPVVVQRAPTRPPMQHVPRGPHGQRHGQRLPPRKLTRAERARRERQDRKDRERDRLKWERARLDEMFRQQTIASNKHWAKHGSEPKTAAQKAFHVFVKFLEAWEEVSTGMGKIDKSASDVLEKYVAQHASLKQNWSKLDDAKKQDVNREVQDLQRRLVDVYQKIAALEKEFADRAIAWSAEQEALLDELGAAVGNPQAFAVQVLELAVHAGKCSQIKTDFDLGRRQIEQETASLSQRLTPQVFVVPPVDVLPPPRMNPG